MTTTTRLELFKAKQLEVEQMEAKLKAEKAKLEEMKAKLSILKS